MDNQQTPHISAEAGLLRGKMQASRNCEAEQFKHVRIYT